MSVSGDGAKTLANILVIDDEGSIREGCRQTLESEGYRVAVAVNGEAGLQLCREEAFDLVILDLRMPGMSGMQVLKALREESSHTAVIVITGYASIESAVEAIQLGASDYLPKPFTPDILLTIVRKALSRRQLALENLCLKLALNDKMAVSRMIGQSPALQDIFRMIQKVAPTDATVLLTGETGVGKELAARAVHEQSHRRDKPLVAVDCAALTESLLESELFGHVRGAFTGATETTLGKFELASGGTIFLDEIGNIGSNVQAKLLRVLQEREFLKVGGTQRVRVDLRVIAATNKDLRAAVRQGTFRDDLFYRLSVVPIRIPPLRERREDIRTLARYFVRKYAATRNAGVEGISEESLRKLETYDWPGNVRELENTIERALVMCESTMIRREDLLFCGGLHADEHSLEPALVSSPSPLEGRLEVMERQEILLALQTHDWQMAKSAEFLGINRKTLREKIRKYGIGVS